MAEITKEDMIPLLVEASPKFKPTWEEFCEEWKDEKEGMPYYTCLGDYASYLVEKLESADTAEFKEAFEVIENLHLNGDSYVKEAATVGLLEGIQNVAGDKSDLFFPFLLPETSRWWKKLNQFWEEGKLLTDE